MCFSIAVTAQYEPATPNLFFSIVPLTVEKGFPLQIMLTEKLHFKLNETVHGRIIESIYAFDREVIPVGAEVVGRVTGFQSGGKWKRVSSMLGGDFTPVRDPQIVFDTLVLEDGTRLPIETSVDAEFGTVVRFTGGPKEAREDLTPKPIGTAGTQALIDVRKHAGSDLLKGMLWSMAPYHPQSVPAGMRYKATLLQPLDFGSAVLRAGALDAIGSEPPTGSTVYARLETPLDSHTTKPGAVVKALLTRPLFSKGDLLIFPVGSRLVGEVVEVLPARTLRRTGEMAFKFTRIEPPFSIISAKWPTQDVEGRLIGVQADSDMNRVRIDQDGAMRIVQGKERFLGPAFALVNVSRGFNAGSDSFGTALAGAYSGSLIKRFLAGDTGLGIPASIAGRMISPVGMGLGLYSAARSVFFNLLAKGPEIKFAVDTPIEIRIDDTQ
jgi:hypothetical protein